MFETMTEFWPLLPITIGPQVALIPGAPITIGCCSDPLKKLNLYLTNSAVNSYVLIVVGRDGGIWQTRKIQDLVGVTPVRVQVPLAAR